MAPGSVAKRLRKEFSNFHSDPPQGVRLHPDTLSSGNMGQWMVLVDGAEGTLYAGEHFVLELTFRDKYPFEAPSVKFVGQAIPMHPHIYSNGHICLNILTDDWTPALTVSSICISILSMLSSCTEKKKPPDDSMYVAFAPKDPKKTTWLYDDDTV